MSDKTLANGVFRDRRGQPVDVGGARRLVIEFEAEVLCLKLELAEVSMERDILKNFTEHFAKASYSVRTHIHAATPVSPGVAVSGPRRVLNRLLCLAARMPLERGPRECPTGSGDPGGVYTLPPDVRVIAAPNKI